jgi:uncharacterized protein (TIGR03382 family)
MLLAPAGGWTYRADAPPLAPGPHSLELRATSPAFRELTTRIAFDVCAPTAAPHDGDWPQVGGGPEHAGSADAIAPPLQISWSTPVGGTLALGTPVVSGPFVVVATADRAAGDAGGLVALDLATGAVRWRVTTPYPITAAPAIDGDTVVATLGDGEVRGYALADGAPRWQHATATGIDSLASALWAPPVIAGGVVFAGVEGRFEALDVTTGEPVWSVDQHPVYPWLGSLAAPAVSGDSVLASFGRDDGVSAFRVATGERRWQAADVVAINAAPVIVDGIAYVASATGDVVALDVASGARRWSRSLVDGGFDWAYAITAAPAYANGRLFVPTQWNALVALDAATGAELWRATTPGGPLELAHYRSAQPGFAASPIVTGDTVWIGRPDGVLVALAASDGHELWTTQLGAPVLSAPAPAGGGLVVATYDGTVRALVPAVPRAPAAPVACQALPEPPPPPAPHAGGCCDTGGDGSALPVLVVLGVLRRRRRVDS